MNKRYEALEALGAIDTIYPNVVDDGNIILLACHVKHKVGSLYVHQTPRWLGGYRVAVHIEPPGARHYGSVIRLNVGRPILPDRASWDIKTHSETNLLALSLRIPYAAPQWAWHQV